MKTWDECKKEIGEEPKYIAPEIRYRAYKNGECKSGFLTLTEAKNYSNLYEKYCINKEIVDENDKLRNDYENKVFNIWIKSLKEEFIYDNITEDIFNLCYAKSYEDNHSCGYDSIANGMYDIIEFINDIIKMVKK